MQFRIQSHIHGTMTLVSQSPTHRTMSETQMNMWCVGPSSMNWVPSSSTWEQKSNAVQLGFQQVEYDHMHHTHLVFFLCHGFNHF